jgi:hypothetical protein
MGGRLKGASSTCRQIAGCARRNGDDMRIGSGDTVGCGRRLGMIGRMDPCRYDTRVGCERAWEAEHVRWYRRTGCRQAERPES